MKNPKEFEAAFAKAWYKLTHRDMGPISAPVSAPEVAPPQIWQDPLPKADYKAIDEQDVAALKGKLLGCGLSIKELVLTAWASASTFRGSDKRGGANGARVRLAPQNGWEANNPEQFAKALAAIGKVQADFNGAQSGGKKVSLADLIVLGGCAAIEEAARKAGSPVQVPFAPGRTDATAEMTDATAFDVLEPKADGFRNYAAKGNTTPEEVLLVDRAQLLTLTAPQMTVLVGGMRALGANACSSECATRGVLTSRPGTLTNDFFVNLLDMSVEWKKCANCDCTYEGRCRKSGEVKWTASRADLVFGSNSQLRAIAEVYAIADGQAKFVKDFVAAWNKVMNLDRFDLDAAARCGRKHG